MDEKILLAELKQFIAFAQIEGVIDRDAGEKLENFSEHYIKNIITID